MKGFEKCFYDGFLLSNVKENISFIKEKFSKKEWNLLFKNDKSYFFYDEKNLLYYFLNEIKAFKLDKSFVKILAKNEKELSKHLSFLELNSFKPLFLHKEMSLKNEGLKELNFSFIREAKKGEIDEIFGFFSKFFSKELFYFSKKDLEKKAGEILVYEEDKSIKGALIYSKNINSSFLDFIAVDKELRHKNAAFALLSSFFSKNKGSKFFKLFVELSNKRAKNFYERANFTYKESILNFYKNF